MGMATEAAIRRKVNVFSNFGDASGFAEYPCSGGAIAGIGRVPFEALFSDIYAEENNCMSGIAMFIL
jgi:hypothetical protein